MRALPILIFAVSAGACAAQTAKPSTIAGAAGAQVSASQHSELLPDEQAQQVLNRLTFGARPGDAAAVRAMGVDRWIDEQLHPERIADPRVDSLMAGYSVF